jgi:hypothetical protein
VRAPLRRVAAVVLAGALLSACGGNSSEVRDYVTETYEVDSASSDNVEAHADASVQAVTDDLAGRFEPRDRHDEESGTYFRYKDEFVAIREDPAGGTQISVDDDETGSTRWVPIIGPIFLPGGRFGGPGEWNRGGGPGSGK